MAFSNAELQARWRARRKAEIEELRKAPPASRELVEARKEIERLYQRLDEWERFREHYDTWLFEADRIFNSRERGIMSKETFNRFRFALHPDTYQSIDRDERNRLSQKLEELKLALLNKAVLPLHKAKHPKLDWAQMMRRRAGVKQKRGRKIGSTKRDTPRHTA